MDEVTFHREPPSNIPTLVTAFSGWIDAGEAATGAMRFLVRQLAAEPLAAIDVEDFVDFTQVRPVVRLSAEGERTIRWPRSAFWFWQPPAPRAGLLLFRGLEPQRRWRTYATALLDVAARCGVQRIVSLGAMLADLPHTRPPRVTGSSTDPHWHAQFEAWGMARRSRYEGPTGIASVMLEAARRHGLAALTLMGQAPHYLQRTTNPAMRQALLAVVARLLNLELDVSPLDAAVQAFRTRCDQAVAQDAATQAYVRQLEQAYDATGEAAPRPRRDDDFNPEQLMHELEDFLRQERDRGAECRSPQRPVAETGRSTAIPGRLAYAQTSPHPRRRRGTSPGEVAQRVSGASWVFACEIKHLPVAHVCRTGAGMPQPSPMDDRRETVRRERMAQRAQGTRTRGYGERSPAEGAEPSAPAQTPP